MEVELRADDPGLGADDVLVHMGAGDARHAARAAVRNFGAYAGVGGEAGMLAVSVYALVRGVALHHVLAAMPHGRYGIVSSGQLEEAGFAILPTTVRGTVIADWVMGVHCDIAVPVPSSLDPNELVRPSEGVAMHAEAEILETVAGLMALFEPRQQC